MLIRATVAALGCTLLLPLLSMYLQDVPFELEQLGWAFIFSLPIGLSVLRGSLGSRDRLEYPSASFSVLAFWIILIAPWFVTEKPQMRLALVYSDEAVWIGRLLFLLWCTVFVLATGRPLARAARLQPSTRDVFALAVPIALALAYQLTQGRFTNYQALDETQDSVGTDVILAMSLGKNTLIWLPGFLLLVSTRTKNVMMVWFCRVAALASILLMLLSGGRSAIAYAAGMAFWFARISNVRFSLRWTALIATTVPIGFVFMFAYRSALMDSASVEASLRDLTAIASSTTTGLATGAERRHYAMEDFYENVHTRTGIGPQFYAVVDEWLSSGAALEGTFVDGLIRVLPSYFFPGKNEIAITHNFEITLQRSGVLPDVDLAPTPWMQWLYELGVLGIVLGAALEGLLVRWIERRMLLTESTFETAFWSCMLTVIFPAESTSDTLFLMARDATVLVFVAYMLSATWRQLSQLGMTRTPRGLASKALPSQVDMRS